MTAIQSRSRPAPRGVFGGSAWSLGRVSGIEIAIDHSWVLIFALITFSLGSRFAIEHEQWSALHSWGAALATSLLFFASIVLHELGHSLTAQRFGLQVRSITLFVFGGVASLESEPKRPLHEVIIAIAGPLVSVALGLGFSALAAAGFTGDAITPVLAWLGRINLLLAAFNCVPGFPLDGGRVLRGVVWAFTGSFERATTLAAASGTAIAYLMIVFGIATALLGGDFIGGLWLTFIGWFLLTAARASVSRMVFERFLSEIPCLDTIDPVDNAVLEGGESVAEIVQESVLRHGIRTFYVVGRGGQLRGLVTLNELAAIPASDRQQRSIEDVMVPVDRIVSLHPDETAWKALNRMAENGVNQLPVVERSGAGGRLLGAVTRERLLDLVRAGVLLRADAAA